MSIGDVMKTLEQCEEWMSQLDAYVKYVPQALVDVFKVVKQKDVSERTGISSSALSRCSHGAEVFSPDRFQRVLKCLHPAEKKSVSLIQARRARGTSIDEETTAPSMGPPEFPSGETARQ